MLSRTAKSLTATPFKPTLRTLRALRARSVPGLFRRVSRKPGVFEGVSHRVSPGPFRPQTRKCPKSVPRVSPECPGHLLDTPGTLSGYFLDTPEPGVRSTPWDTPSETSGFRGHSRDTSGPKRPKDSCSRPGGSQNSLPLFQDSENNKRVGDIVPGGPGV